MKQRCKFLLCRRGSVVCSKALSEQADLGWCRGGQGGDAEKPSRGQRALDKAHNNAVLAEASTRDPILAHRWADKQASQAEKTK